MRVVIQRVSSASVVITQQTVAETGMGLLILLGIAQGDTQKDADWLCRKIAALRIFPDEQGLMNCDILQAGGQMLVISQFTLHASCKKGNRPSFMLAAHPEQAILLYEYFISRLHHLTGIQVATGRFGADMQVALVNDGPVTIVMDSTNPE